MISRNRKVVVEVRANVYHGHRDEPVELKGTAGNEYVIPAHRISFVHTEE